MSQSREEIHKSIRAILFGSQDISRDMTDFIISEKKRIIEEIMNLYSSEQWEGLKTLRSLL